MGKNWEDFKKKFPWKDLTLGFLIPKAIFLIGISHNKLFAGGLLAILWCLAVFWITHVHERKLNVFAILAVVMILVRIVVVVASKSPALYLFIQALDNAIYGAIFLVSLFFPRSIIQLFAEASGVKISQTICKSPHYCEAWRIVTAVWGVVYMLTALVLIMLNLNSLGLVAIIDIFSGWPIMVVLIIFTMQFPRWYWARKIGEIA